MRGSRVERKEMQIEFLLCSKKSPTNADKKDMSFSFLFFVFFPQLIIQHSVLMGFLKYALRSRNVSLFRPHQDQINYFIN